MAAATSAISSSSPRDSLGTLPTSSVRRLPRCVAFFAMASAMAKTIRTRSSPGTGPSPGPFSRAYRGVDVGPSGDVDGTEAGVRGGIEHVAPRAFGCEHGDVGEDRAKRSFPAAVVEVSARSVSLDIFSRELARASAISGWPPTTAKIGSSASALEKVRRGTATTFDSSAPPPWDIRVLGSHAGCGLSCTSSDGGAASRSRGVSFFFLAAPLTTSRAGPRRPRVRGAEGRASGGGRVRSILSRVSSETAFGNWRRGCVARVARRRLTDVWGFTESPRRLLGPRRHSRQPPRDFCSPSSQERRFVFVRFPLVGVSRAKNLQFEILLTWRARPFSGED